MEVTREQVQKEALEKFKKLHKGTICLSTGTGKSKIAIDFIKETEDVHFVLITSPRTNLQENWKKELRKWGLIDNTITKKWRIKGTERQVFIVIENIQTTYKWENEQFDLIIADEIHTMMTPEYSMLFEKTKYRYLLGLTATHDITSKNDKGLYYKMHCPIIFEYYDSADDGLINKTKFFIVSHELDNFFNVTVKVGKITKQQGERAFYEYLTERIKSGQKRMLLQGSENWFDDAREWFWNGNGTKEQKFAAMMYLNSIKARKDFLLNLSSSAMIAERIKNGLLNDNPDAKVLIFSELTAQADKITKNTVHSNKHKDINQKLMDDFNAGRIRDLGSCRSLTLGLNLKGATHAIMESYIGSATQSKQKKGRLDRLATDDVAEMWIIRVRGTQVDSWYEQMIKGFDLSDAEYFDSQVILNDGKFDYKERIIKGDIIEHEDRTIDSVIGGGIFE